MILIEVEQRLRSFGLSGHQARVYLRTMELGPLTGGQLADKARVPRSKVYEVCKELIDKGLMEPMSGTPRKFRAMPLSRLLEQRKSQLSREAGELERKHQELEAMLSQMVSRPEVPEGGLAVLQGEARVATHLRLMVRDAQARIQVLLADGSLGVLGQVMEEKPARAALHVVHRLTREDLPKVRRLAERGVLFRHGKTSIPVTSVTVDGNHTLILIQSQVAENPTRALWSTEPGLVAAEEARFAAAWHGASTLARRQKELQLGRDAGTTELLKDEDERTEGFAAFAAACVATLGTDGEPVDLVLGRPFLKVAEDPALRALLARHRTRLLLPFPPDAPGRAIAESAAGLGEARHVPPWLGEQALLVVNHSSLMASVDPATGQLETIIASGEPGLVRWLRRVYELAWQTAGEPRPPGREPATLWNVSHRAPEAEAWLRHVVSIATTEVEVRGPQVAEAYVAKLVENPKVKVSHQALPGAARDSVLVGVDGRLLLVLEGVKFSGGGRLLQSLDACVLTDSPAMLAFQRSRGPGKRPR